MKEEAKGEDRREKREERRGIERRGGKERGKRREHYFQSLLDGCDKCA